MATNVYICADGTLTYGPSGGQDKIIPQALPVAFVDTPEQAEDLIVLVGRRAWDVPEADARFEQQLAGRTIRPGYGPTRRYYYSGQEFERDNVETLLAVMARLEPLVERIKGRGR